MNRTDHATAQGTTFSEPHRIPPMLQDFLANLRVAPPINRDNLTVFPLLSNHLSKLDFLTLNPNTPADMLRVSEISESGSVPELLLENLSDKLLLIVDGQELVGAKQNRMVNLTIMAKPGVPLRIPVSCVERGRWSYRSRHFAPSTRTAFPELRRMKLEQVSCSMAAGAGCASSQGAVWDNISEKAERMSASSVTDAMEDIFKLQDDKVERSVRDFLMPKDAVGAVFAIGPKLVGLDAVAIPQSWEKLFPSILSGYVIDTLDPEKVGTGREPTTRDVKSWISERISGAKQSHYPAIGEGTDLRFEGEDVSGAALMVDDEVAHICAFEKTLTV